MAKKQIVKKSAGARARTPKTKALVLAPATVNRRIRMIRGQRVILDSDLAEIYQVPTKRLNEQVRRNLARFPEDFMFRLTEEEAADLRSQNAASSWGGRRTLPLAFTEHGVSMLASVLNSKPAVEMSITIVRVFVKLCEAIETHKDLVRRMERVEDAQVQQYSLIEILAAEIEQMKRLPAPSRRRIGFQAAV